MSSVETEPGRESPHAAALPFRERVGREEVQAIAFRLGGEMHACDVALVEEVVTRRAVHRLPDMPPRLLGMLRLRGDLVPVLDLAPLLELRLEAERPAVLVVAFGGAHVGMAADAAEEVLSLAPEACLPPPHTGGERDHYVLGLARVEGRLVNLIDLAEMLRSQATLSGEDR